MEIQKPPKLIGRLHKIVNKSKSIVKNKNVFPAKNFALDRILILNILTYVHE